MIVDDDKDRFRALFQAHRSAVLAYARRPVDPDAAADVVAETFLVAWRRLDAVPDDALPSLYGVARRLPAISAGPSAARGRSTTACCNSTSRRPATSPADRPATSCAP